MDRGMEGTWEQSWPWPSWVAVAILLIAAGSVYGAYRAELGRGRRHRFPLLGLRWGQIVLVVFLLFGWVWQSYRTTLPDLVLLLDRSQSMSVAAPTSRFDAARQELLAQDGPSLRWFADHYGLRAAWVGENLQPLDGSREELESALRAASPLENASRLGVCLREALDRQRGRPTAAVVLISDGITTDGPSLSEAALLAKRRGVPLFVVSAGGEQPPLDVALVDPVAEETIFVGESLPFDAKLRHQGLAGRQVTVRLRQAGRSGALDERTVELGPASATTEIRLTTRPEVAGEFEYRLEVEPPPGDMLPHNNAWTHRVTVRDDTIRVLLIQAYPSPEYHFLKRLLQGSLRAPELPPARNGPADPTSGTRRLIELHTILQDADGEFVDQEESALRFFPSSREALFEYDVVIFGDANPTLLGRGALDNLREFVQTRGGSLVFLAGPRYTPLAFGETALAQLLPAPLERIRLPTAGAVLAAPFPARPSLLGIAAPQLQLANSAAENLAVWQRLPGLYWLAELHGLRPGVRTLVEHPERVSEQGAPLAVVCLQFFGRGKVVFQATDETYRWSRGVEGEAPFHRYWLQLIRYLARAKLTGSGDGVELASERHAYRAEEPVRLRARFLDESRIPQHEQGVAAVVENQRGTTQRVELTRQELGSSFEAVLEALPPGEYKAWLVAPATEGRPPSTRFTVLSADSEMQRLAADVSELQQAARISAGRYYELSDWARLLHELPAGGRVRHEPLPPQPVWNSAWFAALFLALLVGEWVLRRHWGLA